MKTVFGKKQMEDKKFSPVLVSISQSFIYRPETPIEEIVRFIRSSLEGVERAEIIIKHAKISDVLSETALPQHIH